MEKQKVIDTLNRILELELAGVVRYTHYSFMVFGPHRMPIVAWLRTQATESLTHAQNAGELVTSLGGYPSLQIAKLPNTDKPSLDSILRESLEHEKEALGTYRSLLEYTKDDVLLEEFARTMIQEEQTHIYELEKMVRSS